MAEIYRLRGYADDGTTIAFEYSTDPLHARPYLRVPENFASQEIKLGEGRATIGSLQVEVVDVPTDPADQDTGHVTGVLAAGTGLTALIGRKAHLQLLVGATYENVINGVMDDVYLHESFASYVITIKDQRENERRMRAFTRATTSSVSPRGVIDGFGLLPDGSTMVPPVTPHVVQYGEISTEVLPGFTIVEGMFSFTTPPLDKNGNYAPPADQIITPKMLEAMSAVGDDGDGALRHTKIRLLWRNVGGGAWTEIRHPMASYRVPVAQGILRGKLSTADNAPDVSWLNQFWIIVDVGDTMPASGATIEFIIGYDAEPTEEYPLHIEGITMGTLLQRLIEGYYSEDAPPILVEYDAVAVAELVNPVIARITEPLDTEDGIWAWVEQNIYAINGYAPTLDEDGEVSPVSYALPDVADVLVQLDDSNCEPLPGWSHTGSDAINVVEVQYQRLMLVTAEEDPQGNNAAGDGLAVRDVTVRRENIASLALLGERPLKIKADTICALGNAFGEPISGDFSNELGHRLALLRSTEALDRFLFGGQHFAVRADRTQVGAVRPGQWFVGACSWWPDYGTGERGANRLLQAVRVTPIDATGYAIELVDAGPDAAPVGAPTLDSGSAVVNADGSVTFNVTAIAAGTEARIDYAVSDTVPAQGSALWQFVDRIDTPGPVTTPPNPAGEDIWIRGRGESPGRRPSAWTAAFEVAIPNTPRVLRVRVELARAGVPTVTYETNAFVQGVRIYYEIHSPRRFPTTFADSFDFAATGSHELDLVLKPGQVIDVRVEPWSGFAAGSVTGAPGPYVQRRAARPASSVSLGLAKFGVRWKKEATDTEPAQVAIGGIPGALVDTVWVFDKLYEEPDDGETEIVPEIDPAVDLPTEILDPANVDSDGYLLYIATRPDRGYQRYIWMIPLSDDGEQGDTYMMRVDPAVTGEAPFFEHIRQSGLGAIDVFGRVNDPGSQGGTLMVWLPGSDFSGAPDGSLQVTAAEMPFSFGPGTAFDSGNLLNDIPSNPQLRDQIALRFDTDDNRTTGQFLVLLEGYLGDLIDEFGVLRVEAWMNSLVLANQLLFSTVPGVGPTLPPDGSEFTLWYWTSPTLPVPQLYRWDGVAWVKQEVDGEAIITGSITAGQIAAGAIGAGAIAAGAIQAAHISAGAVEADKLNIGGLFFVGNDLGAIAKGQIQGAGFTIDLDAGTIDAPGLFIDGPGGTASFSGEVAASSFTAPVSTFDVINCVGLDTGGLNVGGLNVSFGPSDSGGSGFRVLRVLN